MELNNIPKWIQDCKLMTIDNKGRVFDNRSCDCDVTVECPKCGHNIEVERQRIEEGREKLGIK